MSKTKTTFHNTETYQPAAPRRCYSASGAAVGRSQPVIKIRWVVDLAPGSRVRVLNPEPGAPSRGTVVATRDGGRVLVRLDGDDINTSYNEGELAPGEDPAHGALRRD